MTKQRIVILLLALSLFLGWKHLSRSAYETVVLHTPNVRSWDTYTTLWVVEDARGLFIRAENPERLWLDFLRGDPQVELRRGGRTTRYQARVLESGRERRYVDALFREKYGAADRLRRALSQEETVPIRLTPL